MSVVGNVSNIVAIANSASGAASDGGIDWLYGDEQDNILRGNMIAQAYNSIAKIGYGSVIFTGRGGNDYMRQEIRASASSNSFSALDDVSIAFGGDAGNDTIVQAINVRAVDNSTAAYSNSRADYAASSGKDYYETSVTLSAINNSTVTFGQNLTIYDLGLEGGFITTRIGLSAEGGLSGPSFANMGGSGVTQNGSDSSDRLRLDLSIIGGNNNGNANLEANNFWLYGHGGDDNIFGSLTIGGNTFVRNNTIQLWAGDGNDDISFTLNAQTLSEGGTFENNDIDILAGNGNDIVNLSIGQNGTEEFLKNTIGVSGGDGYDVLNLRTYSNNATPALVDFSGGYNTTTIGISFGYFEAVSVSASGTADTILGGQGNDTIDGGFGAPDSMVGGLGDDTYYVDNVADIVEEFFGQGTDSIITTVDLTLSDTQSIERLITGIVYGDGLSLTGNSLANTIVGGEGDDTLIGGEGSDRLTGGAGRDTFLYRSTSEAGLSANRDVILDFVRGEDVVDLSAIQAVAGASTDQAFSFLGTGAYTGQAGELRAVQNGSVAVLQGDVNGDRRSDFQIYLADITASTLQAGDFIL